MSRPYRFLHAESAGAETPAKMSLFDLQDRFWLLEAEQPFSGNETKCYFYWLNRFNAARWPAQLRRFVKQVAADLSLEPDTAAKAVACLQRRGLLRYAPGTRSQAATWELVNDAPNYSVRQPAKAPRTFHDAPNNSVSNGKLGPRTFHDAPNNSVPYKEEEKKVKKEKEEDTPHPPVAGAGGGEAQKKIAETHFAESPQRPAAHTGGAVADVGTSKPVGRVRYDPAAIAENLILPFDTPVFRAGWIAYRTFRQEQGYAPFSGGMQEQEALRHLGNLAEGSEAAALEIIKYSIRGGYKTLCKQDVKRPAPVSAAQPERGAKPTDAASTGARALSAQLRAIREERIAQNSSHVHSGATAGVNAGLGPAVPAGVGATQGG